MDTHMLTHTQKNSLKSKNKTKQTDQKQQLQVKNKVEALLLEEHI